MEKKGLGTIPVKNIKQRICGFGIKEDMNNNTSNNNTMMSSNNFGNNISKHHQQSSSNNTHTKKFT